jgi:hypothetical protein
MVTVMKAPEIAHEVIECKENGKPHIVFKSMACGDTHAQGDIYFAKVLSVPKCFIQEFPEAHNVKYGWLVRENGRGSRHVIQTEGKLIYHFYKPEDEKRWTPTFPNIGMCLEASAPFTVTHPGHGWVTFPAGFMMIGYQRDEKTGVRID